MISQDRLLTPVITVSPARIFIGLSAVPLVFVRAISNGQRTRVRHARAGRSASSVFRRHSATAITLCKALEALIRYTDVGMAMPTMWQLSTSSALSGVQMASIYRLGGCAYLYDYLIVTATSRTDFVCELSADLRSNNISSALSMTDGIDGALQR